MCQYGNQVTLSPTEMLVLRFRSFAFHSAALLFQKNALTGVALSPRACVVSPFPVWRSVQN